MIPRKSPILRFSTKFFIAALIAFANLLNLSYSLPNEALNAHVDDLRANDFEHIEEKTIIENLYYYEDTQYLPSISQIQAQPRELEWKKFDRRYIDFGFTKSFLWLKLRLVNDSGAQIKRVLDLNTRFMNEIKVYLDDGMELRTLLSENETTEFSNRAIDNRYLATEFEIEAGAAADIIIGYWSRGSTVLPLSIHTEKNYYQNWISSNLVTVAFCSVLLFLIGFGFFQFLVSKSVVQLAYIGYVGSGALYIYHMDGLSFKFLWPEYPAWNASAALYLGLSINLFAVTFARVFLGSREKYPKSDKLLLCLFFLCIACIVLSPISDIRYLKKFAFYLTTSTTLICAAVGVVALLNGQKEARFYVAGWFAITTCAAFVTVANTFKDTLHVFIGYDFAKMGIFFDAIMFAMAMADQSNEVRKQRDIANEKQKELLEKELETQKQIALLEDQYQSAMSVAQEKSQALASAGHDLRQPIFTLRSAMQVAIKQGLKDSNELDQFKKGFDYIEALIREYLDVPEEVRVNRKKETKVEEHEEPNSTAYEAFPIDIVLNNIEVMFRAEAEKKQLGFSCMTCSKRVFANPVVVMRMLGNLCENAIKYTNTGRVLIGCRRRPEAIEVQVIDTGLGISKEKQRDIFHAYSRNEANADSAPGLGLGLAIVSQLAKENDYEIKLSSHFEKGTVFSFLVPLHTSG